MSNMCKIICKHFWQKSIRRFLPTELLVLNAQNGVLRVFLMSSFRQIMLARISLRYTIYINDIKYFQKDNGLAHNSQ